MAETFEGIAHVSAKGKEEGRLSVHEMAMGWSSTKSTSKSVNVPLSSVEGIQWFRMGKEFGTKILLKNGTHVKFQGFTAEAERVLDAFCEKAIDVPMEKVELACNGWNWGETQLKPSTFRFTVDGKTAFEFPHSDISQAVIQGKNELSIEFHQDDTANANDHVLTEMRFYVPPEHLLEGEDKSSVGEQPCIDRLHQKLTEIADLGETVEESIVSFQKVMFVTPRGRYDIEFFPGFFTLHGKSFTYKIRYKSVNRIFVLPDFQRSSVVVSLDPGIRHGHAMHEFLQISFDSEEEIELSPNLSEQIMETKYAGRLQEKMEGKYFELVGQVLHAFSGKKVIGPGDSFTSSLDEKNLRCSLKANDGLLFPLESSLFFIPKPPTYLRHDEISSVEFLRLGASNMSVLTKTFDLIVNHRDGSSHFMFTSINKSECGPLLEYFQLKDIAILNESAVRKEIGASSRSGRSAKPTTFKDDLDISKEESEVDEDFEEEKQGDTDSAEYESSDEDGAPAEDEEGLEEEEDEEFEDDEE